LARADTKATTLLSVLGFGLGAIAAGAIAGNWSPSDLQGGAEALCWTGILLAVAAEGMLCWAVMPRLKGPGGLQYFMHVAAYEDIPSLKQALKDADKAEDMQTRTVEQLWYLSRAARTKYRSIQVALALLAAGALAVTLSLIVDRL
jgi:hypothetical protein